MKALCPRFVRFDIIHICARMKSHLFNNTEKSIRASCSSIYGLLCVLQVVFIHVTALTFHKLRAIKVNYSVDLVEKFNEA
jgi:hypothetical protein